jgi:ligand-binding sensor domain-containing protein
MNSRKLLVVALVIATFGAAASSFADISNTAVLFLRIAPGARAAGMGEAFVAIADDASATHWNPAGLGSSPLSGSWDNAAVPESYRPLTAMAALRGSGSGERHLAYDIWAIGAKGLMRFDNKSWVISENFRTRTDQTVHGIVSKYINANDPAQLDAAINRVAEANSLMSKDSLDAFLKDVLAAAPSSFKDTAAYRIAADSLLTLYPLCRIKWENIREARQVWQGRAKDANLSSRDMDRIFSRIDAARNRFIPLDLKVPYSAIVAGTLTVLTSNGSALYVGSTDGLVLYNGRTWRSFGTADGLPSSHVTSLATLATTAVIGTEAGAVMYDGVGIAKFKDTVGLPAGSIQAVAAQKTGDYYAIVNNDLYHFDGLRWSNLVTYTVAVDDTPSAIAGKFAIYGSPVERQKYLDKLNAVPQDMGGSNSGDSSSAASSFTPGKAVMVPYLAEFKGKINALAVFNDEIWVGTSYGLLHFDKNRWSFPGYRDLAVAEGQTVASITQGARPSPNASVDYATALRDINDLTGDELSAGQTIKVRQTNSAAVAAAEVNQISVYSRRVLVSTTEGLIESENGKMYRSSIRGLGNQSTQGAFSTSDELWLSTPRSLVTQSRSQSEALLMHAKWLPELANDLYYEFGSLVTHVGGLGTIGFNVTFISYGSFTRTGEGGTTPLGTFESFDWASSVSYGTSLTNKLKGGISAKFIYSRLSDQGAGAEKGSGTSTGFALDGGLLYNWSPRLTLGAAITNVGPQMSYIDAAQADPLPTNLAIGFAYKLKQTDYLRWLVTVEGNKLLPGTVSNFKREFNEVIWNGGTEIVYANIIAFRAGYIYDKEGQIKTPTLGAGLSLMKKFRFDFAYIPSSSDLALANTLRVSMAVGL